MQAKDAGRCSRATAKTTGFFLLRSHVRVPPSRREAATHGATPASTQWQAARQRNLCLVRDASQRHGFSVTRQQLMLHGPSTALPTARCIQTAARPLPVRPTDGEPNSVRLRLAGGQRRPRRRTRSRAVGPHTTVHLLRPRVLGRQSPRHWLARQRVGRGKHRGPSAAHR